MKTVHTHTLRVLHKWIGLVIGLQFLMWALSGTVMAILPAEEVAGGPVQAEAQGYLTRADQWFAIRQELGDAEISGLHVRQLLGRSVYEVVTADRTWLFDARTAKRIQIDRHVALRAAAAAYPGHAPRASVSALRELTLPVRDHQLPIWRVDFADESQSSYFVSGTNGAVLERRNMTWRIWDVMWMLHIMDYTDRKSFNHPIIIAIGFAAVWLAISGIWLLFRTGWKSDFRGLRGRPRTKPRYVGS